MQDVRRVSKPVSNYGSEFEHIASSPSAWDSAKNLIGGRPVTIPADAQDMHDLNEELFNGNDESEMSYGGALNNNHLNGNAAYGAHEEYDNPADDIESVMQEHASVAQTPRQVPQQVSPFRISLKIRNMPTLNFTTAASDSVPRKSFSKREGYRLV